MKINSYMVFAFLIALLMINSASGVQYWQQKYVKNNDTIQIHTFMFWGDDMMEDYVKSGDYLETYLLYDIYPKTWNIDNPNYAVEYCNISVRFWQHLDNSTTIIYNKTYISEDDLNGKYFVRLKKGDGYLTDVYCKYSGIRPITLETPAELTIVTPTWECKECQYYEWTLQERDIAKAELIGNNTVAVGNYIKELVFINFEILIAIFWMILILLAFHSTGFIFIGIYWLFLFLRKSVGKL